MCKAQVVAGDAAKGDCVARPLIVIVSGGETGPLEVWLTKLIDASVASDPVLRNVVLTDELVATQAILGQLPATVKATAISLPSATDFASVLGDLTTETIGGDFAFISVGASIPFACDARLRKAVYASARNAIAASHCDIHPFFAVCLHLLERECPGARLDNTSKPLAELHAWNLNEAVGKFGDQEKDGQRN